MSLVGEDRMRISWITDEHTPAMVNYGTSPGKYERSANGTISSYEYINYTSGEIHDVVIGPLDPNTMYYYSFAPGSTPEYSFKTPPAQFPIKFAISGYTILTSCFVLLQLVLFWELIESLNACR